MFLEILLSRNRLGKEVSCFKIDLKTCIKQKIGVWVMWLWPKEWMKVYANDLGSIELDTERGLKLKKPRYYWMHIIIMYYGTHFMKIQLSPPISFRAFVYILILKNKLSKALW